MVLGDWNMVLETATQHLGMGVWLWRWEQTAREGTVVPGHGNVAVEEEPWCLETGTQHEDRNVALQMGTRCLGTETCLRNVAPPVGTEL